MDNGASSYLRFLNGDKDGFVDIVREYRSGLVMFINVFINDIHMSEEAADNALMKLYIKKPKYRDNCSFKAWLYTIAKNTAIDYLRKLRRKSYVPIEDYYYLADETDIEADYIRDEQNIIIHHALKELNKDYAQVLYLIFFEGLDNPEAAKVMHKSSKQISDLIYRAKKALKAELEKEGQTWTDMSEKLKK